MGRLSADAQVVVSLADAVEAGHVAEVHEQGRLGESQLDQRDEAVAARQQLRLTLSILEDLQGLAQAPRADIVELAGNHRAATLLHRFTRRRCRPVQPGRAQSCGDDRGSGVPGGPSSAVVPGSGAWGSCRSVSARGRPESMQLPAGATIGRGTTLTSRGGSATGQGAPLLRARDSSLDLHSSPRTLLRARGSSRDDRSWLQIRRTYCSEPGRRPRRRSSGFALGL